MMPGRISRVVIVGGGTAGWMTAAMLSRVLGTAYDIALVESEEIGTVGVGEATIPPIRMFNDVLGIDEDVFLRETQATYKLGIEFVGWKAEGERYFHPFGAFGARFEGGVGEAPFLQRWLRYAAETGDADFGAFNLETVAARLDRFERRINSTVGMVHSIEGPRPALRATLPVNGVGDTVFSSDRPSLNYAFQFDAGLYAAFLRRYAEARGVRRREGMVEAVDQDASSGYVTAVRLKDGTVVAGDLFVDCSGFRGLLIEGTLKAGYAEWTQWLPCNHAVAVLCENPAGRMTPYTRSTARAAGWQWRIPLQHRAGNGYVFCSEFIGEDAAAAVLMGNLDGPALKEPKMLRFVTGHRRRVWKKNVVAIGLASGFLEPLESTSIHLTQQGITRLVSLFPRNGFVPSLVERYNRDMLDDYENVRDFLIAHYKVTERDDTPFWRHCRAMDVPDSLSERLEIFRRTGHVAVRDGELFREASWFAVLAGQGMMPERWHPAADGESAEALRARMAGVAAAYAAQAVGMMDHRAFVEGRVGVPATV